MSGHRLVRKRGNTAERILIAKSGPQNQIDILHDKVYDSGGVEVAKTKRRRRLTVVESGDACNAKIDQVAIALKDL